MTIINNPNNKGEIEAFKAFLNKGEPPFQYEKYWTEKQGDRLKSILNRENPLPEEIEVQSSPYCNANCLHCFGRELKALESRLQERGNVDRVIGEILGVEKNGYVIESVKFCGSTGEPLMNPQTLYMINQFSKHRNVTLFSNGIKIGENKNNKSFIDTLSKTKKIVVSLDAGSNNVLYNIKPGAKKRKVDIDDIFEGIGNISSNGTHIDIGYVVTGGNYWDLPRAAIKAKKAGARNIKVRIDMLDSHVRENYPVIKKTIDNAKKHDTSMFKVVAIHSDKEIGDVSEDAFSPEARNAKCFTSSFWTCIGSDGGVYPCGHIVAKDTKNYGNILEENLIDIWNSDQRKKVIEKLPDDRCHICSPASLRRNEFLTFLNDCYNPAALIDMYNKKDVPARDSVEKRVSL